MTDQSDRGVCCETRQELEAGLRVAAAAAGYLEERWSGNRKPVQVSVAGGGSTRRHEEGICLEGGLRSHVVVVIVGVWNWPYNSTAYSRCRLVLDW